MTWWRYGWFVHLRLSCYFTAELNLNKKNWPDSPKFWDITFDRRLTKLRLTDYEVTRNGDYIAEQLWACDKMDGML